MSQSLKSYFFSSFFRKSVCALFFSLLSVCLTHRSIIQFISALEFKPSLQYQKFFEEQIKSCGLDPNSVQVRYAFTRGSVAAVFRNVIVVDPFFWKFTAQGVEQEAVKAEMFIEKNVLPSVSSFEKNRFEKIRSILTSDAQKFIFKHELGHIYDMYYYKKLAVHGLQVIFVLLGVLFCGQFLYLHSLFNTFFISALSVGVGSLFDIFLEILSNFVFKLRKEKKADAFAARFSSADEINAAADFFEQLQKITDEHRGESSFFEYLPQSLQSGHPNGSVRAAYLRRLIKN